MNIKKKINISLFILCFPFWAAAQVVSSKSETVVASSGHDLNLSNPSIAIKIDIQNGRYSVIDKKQNVVVLGDARLSADGCTG